MSGMNSDDEDKHILWTKVQQQIKKTNPYHSQVEKEFILPDGKQKIAYTGHHNPFVIGMALTPLNEIILVREYRPGPERIMMDMPTGSVNAGEDTAEAMARELAEETGYAGEVEKINVTYTAPYSNQERHTFLIRNCVQIGAQKLDHDEFIEVVTMDLQKFVLEYVVPGKTTNAAAVMYCLNRLGLITFFPWET